MSTYVPLTEFTVDNIQDPEHTPLIWNLSFPPNIEADKLCVNLNRLHAIQRAAGFVTSAFTEYQGDQTTFTPGVATMGPDGTATATRAGVATKAETQKSFNISDSPLLRPHYQNLATVTQINKPEMTSKIADRIQAGEKREKAWAKELDTVVRQSLRFSARAHLLKGDPRHSKRGMNHWSQGVAALWTSGYVGDLNQLIVNHDNGMALGIAGALYALNVGTDSMANKQLAGSSLIKRRRWSVSINEVQPDRYFITSALTRATGLIKYKPSTNKTISE
jgi:hypothetical protein